MLEKAEAAGPDGSMTVTGRIGLLARAVALQFGLRLPEREETVPVALTGTLDHAVFSAASPAR